MAARAGGTHQTTMKRFTEHLNAAFAWPVDHGRITALILGVLFVFIVLTLPKGKVDFSL